MACSDEYSRLISLYPLSEDQTPEERAKLEAHIQECAVCRADLEQWRDFLDLIPPAKDVEVPQWVKERVHTNVMKAVRRDRALRALKRAACLVFASAAAVAVLAAGWMYLRGELSGPHTTPRHRIAARPPAEKTQGAPSVGVGGREIARPASDSRPHESEAPLEHPTPATQDAKIAGKRQASLDEEFAAAATPAGALSLLERTLKAAGDGEDVDLQRVIELAEKLRAQWPGSEESILALKLISRCHTEMAEPELACKAFVKYADAAGGRAEQDALARQVSPAQAAATGKRVAISLITNEADECYSRKDCPSALLYYDTVRTRCPDDDAAAYAQFMTVGLNADTGEVACAERDCRDLVARDPSSAWAMRARTKLPILLAKQGRTAEAANAWQEVADSTDDYELQANAYYNKAVHLKRLGETHYPEALALWNKVIEEYPESRAVLATRGMIHQLQNKITGDCLKDFDTEF